MPKEIPEEIISDFEDEKLTTLEEKVIRNDSILFRHSLSEDIIIR